MMRFRNLFQIGKTPAVIGMVHVGALPGTPLNRYNIEELVSRALNETEIYLKHGLDGILVENMHDVPYVKSNNFTPETVASMTRICTEIRKITPKTTKLGVQILAGGNKEALAVALASNSDFIRAEGYVFGHVADEGYIDATAGLILRYRKQIGADNIAIFTDLKKKHSSHAITSDVSLLETVHAADFFLSDGVILTGTATGHAANVTEVRDVLNSTKLPVLVGSGVSLENLKEYLGVHGVIVGSSFKKNAVWNGDLDEKRVEEFMVEIHKLKN